nr:MAG TPA: hypothetical protein [Caudoviricetes sp.]
MLLPFALVRIESYRFEKSEFNATSCPFSFTLVRGNP